MKWLFYVATRTRGGPSRSDASDGGGPQINSALQQRRTRVWQTTPKMEIQNEWIMTTDWS